MKEQTQSKLSEAILAGFVPVIGYALVVTYQVAGLTYFSLPITWIRVSINDVVLYSLVFLAFSIPVLLILDTITSAVNDRTALGRALGRAIRVPILFGCILWFSRAGSGAWIYIAWLSLGSIGAELLLPIFPGPKTKEMKYWERVDYYGNKGSSIATDTGLLISARRSLGLTNFRIAGLTVYVFILCFAFGYGTAERQKDFLVRADSNLVMMYSTDDKMIFVEYDPVTKRLLARYTIESAKPEQPVVLEKKAIGPLLPSK